MKNRSPLPLAFLCLQLLLWPQDVLAVTKPANQTALSDGEVLRGTFSEDKVLAGIQTPLHLMGHFVLVQGRGLLWIMEKPLPTTTVITPSGMVQLIGSAAIKLPVKNYQHFYSMISEALAGDWTKVAGDFNVAPSGAGGAWQMLLTEKPEAPVQLGYMTIIVTGSQFLQGIKMTKMDGGYDQFAFSDTALGSGPVSADEDAAFSRVK